MLKSLPSYGQGYGTREESEHPHLWDDNVLALAPFMGKTGTIIHDHSGYGNHGIRNGPVWKPGRDGPELEYNGSSHYLDLGNRIGLEPANERKGFTIIAEINPSSITRNSILSKHKAAGNWLSYNLEIGFVSDRVLFQIQNDSQTMFPVLQTTQDIPTGERSIIAATHKVFDGTSNDFNLYVNGRVDNGTFVVNNYASNYVYQYSSDPVIVGRRAVDTPDNYFVGKIGIVLFYARALSAKEIFMVSMFIREMYRSVYDEPDYGMDIPGILSRYHDLNGLGGQGQMTWNPLG